MAESPNINDASGEVNSLVETKWDVIVVGGGPAGAICALKLASCGHKVLVIDKDRFPRHKACGDIVMPDALAVLKSCNLLAEIEKVAFEFNSIAIYSPSLRRFDIPGKYLSITRKVLDNILIKAAIKKNANFLHGRVVNIEQNESEATVTVSGFDRPVKCRICVIATGATVDLSKKLDMLKGNGVTAVALSCYVQSNNTNNIAVASYNRFLLPGYAWIFPLGHDGLYNVGCGTKVTEGQSHINLKKELKFFLDSFPPAKELMQTGKIVSKIHGAALRMNLEGNRRLINGRVIAIGETIGTTLPLSGEGIGKAMASAAIASESINSALEADDVGLLEKFTYRVKHEIKPRYSLYRNAERWFYRRWSTDFVVRSIASSSRLQKLIERRINASS